MGKRLDSALVRRSATAGRGLLLVAAALAAAPPAGAAGAGDLAAVRARGKLVMLCFPVQGSPFIAADLDVMREQGLKLSELRRPEQFKGAEVELLQGFARRLGVALELRPVAEGYAGLLPALEARRGDLVASELTITPGRLARVDFSRPYVTKWLAVIARRGSGLHAPADLKDKRGAVVKASSHQEFLLAAVPEVTISPTSFDLESLEAVESGRADFTLRDSDMAPGTSLGPLHKDLEVAFRLRRFGDGIAVRKGSDLLAPLDAYLSALEAAGDLERLFNRYGITTRPPPG